MTITETLAFSLAKFAYCRDQHSRGAVTDEAMWKVCDELAAAIKANDNLHDLTRVERSRRYGWHPRDL